MTPRRLLPCFHLFPTLPHRTGGWHDGVRHHTWWKLPPCVPVLSLVHEIGPSGWPIPNQSMVQFQGIRLEPRCIRRTSQRFKFSFHMSVERTSLRVSKDERTRIDGRAMDRTWRCNAPSSTRRDASGKRNRSCAHRTRCVANRGWEKEGNLTKKRPMPDRSSAR